LLAQEWNLLLLVSCSCYIERVLLAQEWNLLLLVLQLLRLCY
jgi:hypothetical protein